jgi:hypothetical protein
LRWEGRYVDVGPIRQGDTVVLTFPITERRVKEKIGPEVYSLTLKGSTVLSIDPPGKNGPLYQDRSRFRRDQAQWRKLTRFVPEQETVW